jgi:hypothetical protein
VLPPAVRRYCHFMPRPQGPPDDAPDERRVAVGVRAAYDVIARAYHDQLGSELAGKPLDRALLAAFHIDSPDLPSAR